MKKLITVLLPTLILFSAIGDDPFKKPRPIIDITLGLPGPYNPNVDGNLVGSTGIIFQNPENKYEHLGVIHNQGMDYARARLDPGQPASLLFEITEEFMLLNGIPLRSIERDKLLVEAHHFDDEYDRTEDKIKLLISKGYSEKGAKTAEQIVELCMDGLRKRDQTQLIDFENDQLVNDQELSEVEKEILLSSAAICRHSSEYTLRNYESVFGTSSEDEVIAKVDDITRADMEGAISGGIGGAVAAGPAGALPGAIGGALGNSAARWVMSFF